MDMKEWEDMSKQERIAFGALSLRSLSNYTRLWFELMRGERLIFNWHHAYMCEPIDNWMNGIDLQKSAVINIPPGGTKTEYCSVHLPAYCTARVVAGMQSRFRNMNLSYSDELVKRNNRYTMDIIRSDEFQELFKCNLAKSDASEWIVKNDKGRSVCETISKSMGGGITGGRGGYAGAHFSGSVTLDDPDKPEDMFSAIKRNAQHRKLINTVRSRRADRTEESPTPFLLIQQRLHELDSTSIFTSGKMGVDFTHIVVPALISDDYLDSLPERHRERAWKDLKGTPRIVHGGVKYYSYFPALESAENLRKLWDADEYTMLSQYMQDPPSLTGGMFNTDWFGEYTTLPKLRHRAVYVDTNSGKVTDKNDYTVFMLVGVCESGNLYIIDVRRGKWSPKELQEQATALWRDWKKTDHRYPATLRAMHIEDKQAGQGLIVDLQKETSIPVIPVPRGNNQNKAVRFHNIQPRLASGHVYIPKNRTDKGVKISQTYYIGGGVASSTDWVTPFVSECALVSYEIFLDQVAGYDDQVDVMMDAIQNELIESVDGGGGASTW